MLRAKSATQIIVLVLAFAVPFLLVRLYRIETAADAIQEPFSFTLEREAAELNATLPEMVSEGVRLDKTAAGPGNIFTYFYTIVDDDAAKNIAGNQNKFNELRTQLHERVCSTMPERRENGAIINYTLKNNAGETIADISIDSSEC